MSVNERERIGPAGAVVNIESNMAQRVATYAFSTQPSVEHGGPPSESHRYCNSRMEYLKLVLETVKNKLILVAKIAVIWWVLFIVWCSCTLAR